MAASLSALSMVSNLTLLISRSGLSTKPPILMYAFYTLTGNQMAIERMGMGGPPGGMM